MGFSKILDKLQTSKRWISNPFADKTCPVISTWRYISKVSLEESSLLQRDMLIFMPCSRAVMLTERQKAYHAEQHILTAAHVYLKLPLTVYKSPHPQLISPSVIGLSTWTQKNTPLPRIWPPLKMYWNEFEIQIVHYDALKLKNPLTPPPPKKIFKP